jgi:hypothetical protein
MMSHCLGLNPHNLVVCWTWARVLRPATVGTQHDVNEVDCILGAELLHDMLAMGFDRSTAYSEDPRGFLIRRARHDLRQHLDLPAREKGAPGKMTPSDFRRRVLLLSACPSCNRLTHTGNDRSRIRLLFYIITRAIFDRLDRDRNVSARGDDKDRRRIIRGIELFEDVQSRCARQVYVYKDTGRYPHPSGSDNRCSLAERPHLISRLAKHNRQRLAHHRIIVDDVNLAVMLASLQHVGLPVVLKGSSSRFAIDARSARTNLKRRRYDQFNIARVGIFPYVPVQCCRMLYVIRICTRVVPNGAVT